MERGDPVTDEVRPFAERVTELRDRFASMLDRIDLRARVDEHPFEIIGAAALLGAWLGFSPPRVKLREPSTIRVRIADTVLTAIGAIAIRLVREAALRHVGEVARRWWEDASRGVPHDDETEVHYEPPHAH